MLSRDTKILKEKELLEKRNTDKMKTAFDWLTRRLGRPEERISELKDSFIVTSKTENQRE